MKEFANHSKNSIGHMESPFSWKWLRFIYIIKLNEYMGDIYPDRIQRKNYKSVSRTILKYFTSLLINVTA